ncbi:hypothetical protein [Sandaracinobacteroides hominis]|uniref:hypothetical protein n=1 Tax=Sandaracinobacteroides hominis TaxID=2780086 RepID=UPI0018F5DF78|nr:hypothetical protein [Sandaracinobacteroides hominis]
MQRILLAAALMGLSAAAIAQTAPAEPVPPTAPAAPAAPGATATPAAPAMPAPPPLPEDKRDRVTKICMDAAEAKAKTLNATVALDKVQDTDVKSDGYASMRAKVKLTTVDSKGKSKTRKGTFGCATRNDVVTSFNYD